MLRFYPPKAVYLLIALSKLIMQKFTQEQLMLFLYGEASPILKLAIDKALKEDANLKKELATLRRSKKQLEEMKGKPLSPSQKSIDAILKYAKDTAKKK